MEEAIPYISLVGSVLALIVVYRGKRFFTRIQDRNLCLIGILGIMLFIIIGQRMFLRELILYSSLVFMAAIPFLPFYIVYINWKKRGMRSEWSQYVSDLQYVLYDLQYFTNEYIEYLGSESSDRSQFSIQGNQGAMESPLEFLISVRKDLENLNVEFKKSV